MTTFVPLAADIDGTLSAVALGDWLLQIIKTKKPNCVDGYYSQFLKEFVAVDNSDEQRIGDPTHLFTLLLSQESLIFEYLLDARDNGEVTLVVSSSENNETKEKEIRKTFVEVHKEVEEFFEVLMSMLVLRFEDAEQSGKAAGSLCDVFKRSKEMPEFRLKLLQSLYNVFPPNFPYRFPIFVATLEYAAEANLFHTMVPYIKYVDEWMKDWNFRPEAKRQVFLILANQLKKLGNVEDAYSYLKRHVECFQDESQNVLQEGATISAAVELAEDSIKLPDVTYFDSILELDAVKYLRKTSHKNLVELLEIFTRGGPKEFVQFYEPNKQLFGENGLDYNQAMEKIRLLAVASLAVGKHELGFDVICEDLGLSLEQAEEVVVQSIGQSLLDAKIDQMNHLVLVKSAMNREFVTLQWEQLWDRLKQWDSNVRCILGAIQQAKQHPGGTGMTSMVDGAM